MQKLFKRSQALIVMLAFLLVFAPMSALADAGKKEETINYVALGDSLAAGVLSNGELGIGYVSNIVNTLENKGYKVNPENLGVRGATSEELKKGLQVGLADEQLEEADIVTISVGANDVLDPLEPLKSLLEGYDSRYTDPDFIASSQQKAKQDATPSIEALSMVEINEKIESLTTAVGDVQESVEANSEKILSLPNGAEILEAVGNLENDLVSAVNNVGNASDAYDNAVTAFEENDVDTIFVALSDSASDLGTANKDLKSISDEIDAIETLLGPFLMLVKEQVDEVKTVLEGSRAAIDNAKTTVGNATNGINTYKNKLSEIQRLYENALAVEESILNLLPKVGLAISSVGENMTAILESIKTVNPTAKIYVMGYYNALPYLPVEIQEKYTLGLLNGLNEAIELPAVSAEATFIPTSFANDYTKYLPNPENIHPSEAGYSVIFNAFMGEISKQYPEIIEPEEPETPSKQQIDMEEETAVSKGQLITINGTNVALLLPDNLPEGTTLTVTPTDEEILAKAEDINAVKVGDVLNFSFKFPVGFENYEGTYELVMGYDENAAETMDIYYFNENTNKWESQNGEIDKNSKVISLTTTHFSNYGVFVSEEMKTDPPEEPINDSDKDDNEKDEDHKLIEIEDEEKQEEKVSSVLPNTATNHFNLLWIGVMLIGLAVIIWYIQRKRRQTE